jgi:hypothetical protein
MKKYIILILLLLLSLLKIHSEDFFAIKKSILENHWKKILIFYLTPTLTLNDFGYSNNIYSYTNNPTPDFRANIGVDIKISSILKDAFIFATRITPYYSFYAKNKKQQALNYSMDFTSYTHLSRINLKYNFIDRSHKQRPTAEFGVMTRIFNQSHYLSSDFGNHNNFYISAFFKKSDISYGDDLYLDKYNLKNRMDRKELRLGLKAYKRIFTSTMIFLSYEYYNQVFSNMETRDGTGRIITAGVQFPEISSIKGSLQLGIKEHQPDNIEFKKFLKSFGQGKISIRILGRFILSFDYRLDSKYSFWEDNVYYDEQSLGFGASWYLSSKFKLIYRQNFNHLSYRKMDDGLVIRTDDITLNRLSLAYRLKNNFGVGIYFSHFSAESDFGLFSREYNFLGGFITYDF